MLINCASHPFRASINLGSGGSVWFSVLFCFSLAENERIMCCNHVCVDCNEKKNVYSNISKANMDVVFRSMLGQGSTMEGNLCVTM